MVLENDGICLEYYVLKVSCNLLLSILFIPFCRLTLYSGSPQKQQGYFITTTTYVGEQNIQISCWVVSCETTPPQNNGTWKFPKELLIPKAQLSAQKTPGCNRVTCKKLPGETACESWPYMAEHRAALR